MFLMTLDLGERVGWTKATDKGEPSFGVERLPHCGENYGGFGLAFKNWLAFQCHLRKPDRLGFATPLSLGKERQHSDRILNGLTMVLEVFCAEAGIEMMEDNEQVMRTSFVAPYPLPTYSEEINVAIVARCNELGWKTTDWDEAASLCVMEFMRANLFPDWPSAAERSGLFK